MAHEGDWGDLVNGDHERDLGTNSRRTLYRELLAERRLGADLAAGLRRIEAAREMPHASDCAAWAQEPCDCIIGGGRRPNGQERTA